VSCKIFEIGTLKQITLFSIHVDFNSFAFLSTYQHEKCDCNLQCEDYDVMSHLMYVLYYQISIMNNMVYGTALIFGNTLFAEARTVCFPRGGYF